MKISLQGVSGIFSLMPSIIIITNTIWQSIKYCLSNKETGSSQKRDGWFKNCLVAEIMPEIYNTTLSSYNGYLLNTTMTTSNQEASSMWARKKRQ